MYAKLRTPVRAAVLGLGLVALPAMAQNVAKVNGQPIPQIYMDVIVKEQVAQGLPDNEQLRQAVKDELIRRAVIAEQAKKAGLDKSPEVKAEMELARQGVLVRAYLKDFVAKNPVSEEEIKNAYAKITAMYSGDEFHTRHILVEKEEEAKDIIAKLGKGASWDELVKQSQDPGSKDRGGDLGWVTPDMFVPDFGTALGKMQKGETSKTPVKTQFGYHVIHVDDVRPQSPPPLEQIRPQIEQQLQQQKIQKHLEELVAKAKVE
jgi:peptidyl-prolyl cis-trans isomerase C